MAGEPKKNPFWSLLFSAVLSQILAERPIDALKRRTRAAFSRVISPLRKKDPTKVLEKEKREEAFFEDQTERMRDLYNDGVKLGKRRPNNGLLRSDHSRD